MTDSQSWGSSLSFSDRFSNVINIQNALKRKNSSSDASQLRAIATQLETSAFDSSASKIEYDANIQQQCSTSPLESEDEMPVTEPKLAPAAIAIGAYQHATHHADGLFSFVFKAKSPVDDSLVALKVTTPSATQPPHDSEREVRILKAVRHERVIRLIEDFPISGGRLVLAFPYLPYNFGTLLANKKLKPELARSHMRDLFTALQYLHASGFIHRDIKPSNLLLATSSGPAYLADFGIAWSPTDKSSEPSLQKITDVGTTCYRPPELLFGNHAYGTSLDLWAAGCVVAQAAESSHETLFDAGEYGSEFALIYSIFKKLGTPTLETWPEAANFQDWGKMQFQDFPSQPWSQLLPTAEDSARDLVSKLVQYESGNRITASSALQHPYLAIG